MQSRRVFLRVLSNGLVFAASYPLLRTSVISAATLEPTPSNTEGPFYKAGAPFKTDLREQGEPGTSLHVSGAVVDTQNKPIRDALIEVWHTDQSGQYDLSGYKHRASIRTSENGAYHFQTIMPGGYGGRPRHIHYKIHSNGFENLVTQLYFENDPFFEGRPDMNYRKDRLVQYRELIKPVVPFKEGSPAKVIFQICLAKA